MMQSVAQPVLVFGQVEVHLEDLWIRCEGATSDALTPTEAKLLSRLAMEMGGAVERDVLLVDVWDYHPNTQTRTVDATVRRLRTKIEQDPACPEHLLTVRGQGYRLVSGGGSTREDPSERPPLPHFVEPFVGRKAELEALSVEIEKQRGVVVMGAAGTGKTRIVTEWITRSPIRPGLFCELEGVTSLKDAVVQVARSLNLPLLESAGVEDHPAIVGRCLGRSGLQWVVLDHVEQLSGIADLVSEWVRRAPAVSFILTTRHRLTLRSFQTFRLGCMDVADAVDLFRQTAGLDTIDTHREDTVTSIVEALDCLPLAIQLAASRLDVLGLEVLRERVESPLVFLDESTVHESRGLRAVMQASWDVLNEDEQCVLAWCSLFQGGFNAALLERLMGEDAAGVNGMQCIGSLQGKSLIHVKDASLGSMRLLNVMRQFVSERAEELGIMSIGMNRFASVTVEWAESWHHSMDASKALVGQRHLLSQAQNLHYALALEMDVDLTLRLAMVLEPVLEAAGPYQLLVEVLDSALLRAAIVVKTSTVHLMCRRGWAYRQQGKLEDARRDANMALNWAESIHATLQKAESQVLLASIDRRQGYLERAERHASEAIETSKTCGDLLCEARAWASLGAILTQGGRFAEAQAALENALFKNPGDWRLKAAVEVDMGLLHRQLGRWDLATVHLERGLGLYEAAEFVLDAARVKGNLGVIELEVGALVRAERLFGEAIQVFRSAVDRRSEGQVLVSLAVLYRRQARFFEAEACLRQAMVAHREAGSQRSEGVCENNLALLCIDQGRFEHASMHLERALMIHRDREDRRSEMIAMVNQASVLMEQGDIEQAIERLRPLCQETLQIGDRPLAGVCWFNLGLGYHLAGQLEDARRSYGMAIHWAGIAVEGLDAKMFGALVMLELGHREQAHQWLEDVREQLEVGQYPIRDIVLQLFVERVGLQKMDVLAADEGELLAHHLHHSQDLRFAQRLVTM